MNNRRTQAQASADRIARADQAPSAPPAGAEMQMLAIPLREDREEEHDAIRALMYLRLRHDCQLPVRCLHRNHRRDLTAIAGDMALLGLDVKARRARSTTAEEPEQHEVPAADMAMLAGLLR
jgi:hypothetical protein